MSARASRALAGGMDVNLSGMDEKPTGSFTGTIEAWTFVALFGIHQELKKLNALLHCPNFTGLPQTMRVIEKNTRKKRKKKATVTNIKRAA